MTTIQMTIEEKLLKEMDRTVKRLKTTRSALIRDSIRRYLREIAVRQRESQHRAGYEKHPVKRNEFDVWESEQIWAE